jgi:hypothetical protein
MALQMHYSLARSKWQSLCRLPHFNGEGIHEEPFDAALEGRGRPGPYRYALLLVLLSLAAIGSIGGLATAINGTFANASTALKNTT